MYQPKFNYSHSLVRKLCDIQFLTATVNERSVPEKWNKQTRKKALQETISNTLLMENIAVPAEIIGDILTGDADKSTSESMQNAINFHNALLSVEEQVTYGAGFLSSGDIKDLNRHCLHKLKKAEWYCGKFREIQNWVVDSGKEVIVFTPPSPEEVPELVNDLVRWMKDETTGEIHPVVKAAIAHQRIMYINPFVAGNERVASLVSRYVLRNEGYFVRNWGWLTDYYAKDMTLYYQKIVSGLDNSGTREKDLTEWLEYFADGVRESFARVEKESQSNKIKPDYIQETSEFSPFEEGEFAGEGTARTANIESLNERQRQILELGRKYTVFHRRDIRSELELAGRYHPKTISRDLKALVDMGYLKQMGERKGVRYSLIRNNK